jgi:hypothetical protein
MNSEPSPLEQLFLSEAKWALLKAHGPSIVQSETWHQKSTEPTVRSITSGHTCLDRQCPLVRRSIIPTYLKKKIRQFDLVFRQWTHPLDHSI